MVRRSALVNIPSFSIVVIARNEAATLPSLIASLQEFLSAGGELLVVDTGSDDDTIRVAREAGARVESAGARFHSSLASEQAAQISARFIRNNEGCSAQAGEVLFDFGRARQFASELASNDFVWHIDASDVILSADFDFLDASVRSGGTYCFDYLLATGRWGFRVARFFDRRLYVWKGRVHEAPFGSDRPTNRLRVSCDERQLSLRHVRNEKTRNYLAGLALDVIAHPSVPRWKHYLGRELYYERRYRSAMRILREHSREKHGSAAERGESLCLVGACLEALGHPEAAASSYFRASRIDPTRRQPLLKLAVLCQSRGHFQSSVAFAAAALMVPRVNAFLNLDENQPADPHALLYWGLFWLGRRDEARIHWETCRRMDPENEKFREDERLFAMGTPGGRRV